MSLQVVLVRGAGDLASGVALRLQRAGLRVLLTEIAQPLAVRRTVSFSEAVYQGRARVENVTACLAVSVKDVYPILQQSEIPILVDPELEILENNPAEIAFLSVVDARLVKQSVKRPPVSFVVGLGPGFVPGENCNAVVETMRGHTLGRVYWDRPAAANTGFPEGDPARVLRAPCEGILLSRVEIGVQVGPDAVVAVVDPAEGPPAVVRTVLGGVVRGMLRSGQRVWAGMKIGDIDQRANPEYCLQVSDKALAVGGGVLEALLSRPEIRQALSGGL